MKRWLWVLGLLGCDAEPDPLVDQGVVDQSVDAVVADAAVDAAVDAADMVVDAVVDAMVDAAPTVLSAAAGPDVYAELGVEVALDGATSTGAVAYQWDFGDGQRWEAPRPSALGAVTYARPGRYRATLTAIGADGSRDADGVTVSVTWPVVFAPQPASSIVRVGPEEVAVVVPDADLVVRIGRVGEGFGVISRHPTCNEPRTVARWGEALAVACPADDAVVVHGDEGNERVDFPRGSRPYGVAPAGDDLAVTLQGTGRLARLTRGPGGIEVTDQPAIEDARGVAALPDGRLAVTRWRSPDGVGRAVVVDSNGGLLPWTLANDPQAPSDTEIGGVPGYLGQVLVSPTGREVALPSLQANTRHGPLFDGLTPAFDTVLRAVVSFVDPVENTEDFGARKQIDGRGFASAGVYTSRGDYLFLAMRGSGLIERLDRLSGDASGTLVDAGFAVEGLALSADDHWLFADASLSREVRIFDVRDLSAVPLPAFTVPTIEVEPLDPVILRGKQLFNDAGDPRLSRDGYIACAHCHLDGDSDRLTWDFTARGEGVRNTISLLGRAGTAHGPVHWSANFDEIHDFEHDLRGPNGGLGLMSDAAFAQANTPLGPPKAGLSADLDALAAYVGSLDTGLKSPLRSENGDLSDTARRGEAVFQRLACDACHTAPTYTDSGWEEPGVPNLHDVGTMTQASGQRLGGPLVGIDTPTLVGLFDSAPYLHDGRAQTLRAVLLDWNPVGLHGDFIGVSDADLADLEAFLLSLEAQP